MSPTALLSNTTSTPTPISTPPLPPTTHPTLLHTPTRRRTATLTLLSSLLPTPPALAFDFRFVAPDQTTEEARAGVRPHARDLVELKPLIESGSWGEMQVALREASGRLKQDVYTIIQSVPGDRRGELRRLYSDLFNNVTRMDYAARSKDASLVQIHYDNMVAALDNIFSRIREFGF